MPVLMVRDRSANDCVKFCFCHAVIEHSIDPDAPTAGLVGNSVVTKTTTETVTLSTTVVVTTTVANLLSQVTVTVTSLPSSLQSITPKPTSSHRSSAVCSTNNDSDDNSPVYVSIAIVTVGVFVMLVIVMVGVIMCRRHYRGRMQSSGSSDPLMPNSYGSVNATSVGVVTVDNDLYGRKELQ